MTDIRPIEVKVEEKVNDIPEPLSRGEKLKRYRSKKEADIKKKRQKKVVQKPEVPVASEEQSREDIEIQDKALRSQDELYQDLKAGLDNLNTTMSGLLPSIQQQLVGSFGPLIDRINELGASHSPGDVVPFPDPNEKFGRIQEPTKRYDLIGRQISLL
jgi:hypothetical protein